MSLSDLYWLREVPAKLPQWGRITRTRIFQPPVMGIPQPVLLQNSAEGGTSTVTVTTGNSGGASGNAWDQVSITGTGALTFDSTHIAHGVMAYSVADGSPAGNARMTWLSSLTKNAPLQQVWFRFYLYMTANPSGGNTRVARFFNGAAAGGFIAVNASGQITLLNASGSQVGITTASIALNAWNRIEGFFTASSVAGQISVSLYKTNPDGFTADETQTTTAAQNTSGNISSFDFGNPSSTTTFTFWMDELALSNTGPVGPSNTGPQQIARQPGYRPRWAPAVRGVKREGRVFQPQMPQSGQGTQFPLWTRQGGYSPRWAPVVRGVKREGRFFQPGWGQGTQGSPFPVFIRQAGYRPRWKPQERLVSSRRRAWWPPQPLPYLICAEDADAAGSIAQAVVTPTAPGDTILVGAGSGGAATATGVSDTQGNRYQLIASSGINSSNNSAYAFACYEPVPLTKNDTITVTFSSAQNGQAMIATGVPSGYALLDQAVSALSSSSASPSVTTSHALGQPEALFAVLVSGNAGGTPAWNAGWAPLSTRHHAFGDAYTSMAFELASSGSQTAGAAITAANYAMVMVTLAQGQAFPTFIRRGGYSPLRWAPPPRVTRSRVFQPQMPQANQGALYPTWARQPGYSPKWAPAVRGIKREGRRFEPSWPQGFQGAQFPLWARQPGYSPKWAPPARVTHGRTFQPPMPQANQGVAQPLWHAQAGSRPRWAAHYSYRHGRIFLPPLPQAAYRAPIWIRQGGFSPKWLPDRYPARGRRSEPGWGQGTLSQPWPSVTRQPGWHPRWIPFTRQVRGRLFQPPAPITDFGAGLFSGAGTLAASALVTEMPSGLLGGQGTLGATAILLIQDSASLSASGTLMAPGTVGPTITFTARGTLAVLTAFAGADPAGLWLAYQSAQRAADIAEKSWEETVIAGGTGGQSGMAYTKVYRLQLAASQAYASWLAAHDAWLAAGEPGGGPG